MEITFTLFKEVGVSTATKGVYQISTPSFCAVVVLSLQPASQGQGTRPSAVFFFKKACSWHVCLSLVRAGFPFNHSRGVTALVYIIFRNTFSRTAPQFSYGSC